MKGTPNTKGLELLVRKQLLTPTDWFRLIEARRSFIKPHFNSFTLTTLRDFSCLRSGFHNTHSMLMDIETTTGDRWFSLSTQGIFYCPKSSIQRFPKSGYQAPQGGVSCPDGLMYIWGLTRDARWILVKLEFKGEAGHKNQGYERAIKVHIQQVNLEEIITETKSTPEEIWRELGRAIKNWTECRRRLFHKALEIARTIETEELVLSLCQRKE